MEEEEEEEEDDEELFRMLEEDVENPNDKKPRNIVPTRVRTKVSRLQTKLFVN